MDLQTKIEELKRLHQEIQDSDKKVTEFLTYLEDLNVKKHRLDNLRDALYTIFDMEPTQDNNDFYHWSLNEESCVWEMTTCGYDYSEEDIAQMEKIILPQKLEDGLSEKSTNSKKTKI